MRVPEVGIEPTCPCERRILSPLRLPVSPLRLIEEVYMQLSRCLVNKITENTCILAYIRDVADRQAIKSDSMSSSSFRQKRTLELRRYQGF
jgi:hypothetical protein